MSWLVAASPLCADEGGEWTSLAPLATPRQETGAARIGQRVYVVGGLMSGARATASVEVYDVVADRWSEVAPLPVALDHMGVAAVAGKLYVVGGFAGDFNARSELWIYDPAVDEWSAGAAMPEARGALWAVAFGPRLYVFGGTDAGGAARDSTFIYDPAGDEWSVGAPMTQRREHLNAVVVGDFIYVLGGRAGPSTARNERYHPQTDTWRTLAPMPTARSAAAVAAHGGRIYVMGGEVPRLFAVNEVYDPETDSWDCAAAMPVPRHGVAAVPLDAGILVPGGGVVQGLLPTDVVDLFVPQGGGGPSASSFHFSRGRFRVSEGGVEAPITVRRQGATAAAASVGYATAGGDATAGVDYRAVSGTLSFADGETVGSFGVPVFQDEEAEGDETVELRLLDPVGGELGSAEAILVIEDDDVGAPGRLGWDAPVFVTGEGAGSVALTVVRDGGRQGTVTVTYRSEGLGAVAGLDYEAISGVLEWQSGDLEPRTVVLPVLDDAGVEGSELVRLVLLSPTGGATLAGDATAVVVLRDDDGAAACAAGEETLCLLEERFRVEVVWRNPRDGSFGPGRAAPELDPTGLFSFFDPANVELVVKVLDGRALTGAFWFFYGALSDVEYWILATDTGTGVLEVFHNPPLHQASFADTQAFPAAAELSPPGPGGAARPRAVSPGPGGRSRPCVADPATLCLGQGRFRVEVSWLDPSGLAGTGTALPHSDETGLFWFFNPENIELAVKILDARALTGTFWLFYGALSNVEYTLTVTDTETGAVRQYVNEQGNLASVADVEAFGDP